MKKFLQDIRWFILCLLKDQCIYSAKKILMYVFSAVIIYLVIFTTKDYLELLTFVAVLAGIRSYETVQTLKINKPPEKG